MNLMPVLLAAQAALGADTVPAYLAFPEVGLDDPAAYQGYETRVYRDAHRNAFQVYLNLRTGRVVHLWANAANESVGFTARDAAGRPAAISWSGAGAAVSGTGGRRSVAYSLEAPSPTTIGLFLLGSMRVERDFQYAGRDSLPFGTVPFPQPELLELIAHLERLPRPERARHLELLEAPTLAALRSRLEPDITLRKGPSAWALRVGQQSFDGRNHLTLALEADTRETDAVLTRGGVILRARPGHPVRFTVRVSTDAPALTPLSRDEIFNEDFHGFYEAVRADTARPELFRRLEREVRGAELLSYREKLMAGLPNYATYFGRDMLMTALLMRPVWRPEMHEHVIASALRKLGPEGDVSHEEALGGQAIREHAAEYNRLVERGLVDSGRILLANLQAVRENYVMVDDDFQLPVVAATYLADARVSTERKRRFLLEDDRLGRLVANLGFVARRAAAYAQDPAVANLVSFPPAPDGGWISASWRDSRAGYGGGRFALDVNAIWVPWALESIGAILDALSVLGFTGTALDSLAPAIRGPPLAAWARDRQVLTRAAATWRGAERHFQVALIPEEAGDRVAARLDRLPRPERDYWDGVRRGTGFPADTLRFLALSLDADGRPIPIVNTDPAMLLLEPVGVTRASELIGPIMLAYPWGLFVDEVGPLVANDAYASPEVWDAFRQDAYHSPTVVWGREVNTLLVGLATQILAASAPAPGTGVEPLRDALRRTVAAVERSGFRHAELWSYQIDNGRLVPTRYGTSSDVQLWSLTDLAVQYLLTGATP